MSGQFSRIERHVTSQGQCLAYKIYSKSHGQLVYRHFTRELWAFQQLNIKSLEESRNKHIVFLIEGVETPSSYQLVFPFYRRSLEDVLFDGKDMAARFMQDISQGLAYLHERDIIHCDLSPSNILIDDDGNMLISDFGCAQKTGYAESEVVGTCFYLAPEHLFNYKQFAPSTDIWSLGVIFAVLLTGVQIFDGENHILQLGRIKFRLGKPSEKVEKEEIAKYPDYKKLMFFEGDDGDDEVEYEIEYDSVEEYEEIQAIRKPLKVILQEHNVSDEYQKIILGILTWSIKDRLTIPEIIKRFQ